MVLFNLNNRGDIGDLTRRRKVWKRADKEGAVAATNS